MKITLINSEHLPVPPVLGGAIETTIFETALSIKPFHMSVISPWVKQLDQEAITPPNVFHHVDIGSEKRYMHQILGSQLDSILQGAESPKHIYYLHGVTNLIEDINPDVIQIHNRIHFAPYFKKQFPNKQVVVYLHNHPEVTKKTIKKSIPDVDRLVFVSHYLAHQFHRQFPSSVDKSCVIHNSVDTTRWHPRTKKAPLTETVRQKYNLTLGQTILFCGRTVYHKGISVLIEAIDLLKIQFPHIKLLIIGSPFFGAQENSSFLHKIKKKAHQLEQHIQFTGFVPHDQTPYYYGVADITVVPSIWHEPFGKVVIESMATGTPVIASRRGAIPEIIDHNQNGLLIEDPRNPEHLAAAIKTLLESLQKRETLGDQGRFTVESNFSKNHRLNITQLFYETLKTRYVY